MVKVFILFFSLFLISCSEINTNKSEMNITVENNTSYNINKILVQYGNEQFQINKLKKGDIVKNTILVGSDISFNITIYVNKEQITIKNIGYYYYNGENNVKLIFRNKELIEKKESSIDEIKYSYNYSLE